MLGLPDETAGLGILRLHTTRMPTVNVSTRRRRPSIGGPVPCRPEGSDAGSSACRDDARRRRRSVACDRPRRLRRSTRTASNRSNSPRGNLARLVAVTLAARDVGATSVTPATVPVVLAPLGRVNTYTGAPEDSDGTGHLALGAGCVHGGLIRVLFRTTYAPRRNLFMATIESERPRTESAVSRNVEVDVRVTTRRSSRSRRPSSGRWAAYRRNPDRGGCF